MPTLAEAQVCSYRETFAAGLLTLADQTVQVESRAGPGESPEGAAARAVGVTIAPELDRLIADAYVIGLAQSGRIDEDADLSGDIGAIGELMRADKQIGAPAGSAGTTTVSERAALPMLLGFAFEHGAVQKEQNGDTFTVDTSPYALWLITEPDTQDLYQSRRGTLSRMIGVSASFAMSDPGSGMNDLTPDTVSSVRAKVTLGDRSTRSAKFHTLWVERAQPVFEEKLDAQIQQLAALVPTTDSVLTQKRRTIWSGGTGPLATRLTESLTKSAAPIGSEARAIGLAAALGRGLCESITIPANRGELEADTRLSAEELEANRLRVAELDAHGRQAVKALVQAFQGEQLLASLVYDFNRVADGSDHSDLRFVLDGVPDRIFGGWLQRQHLTINAFVSLNHDPDAAIGQEALREYGVNISLNPTFQSPLHVRGDEFSRIAISIAGSFERLAEIDANLGVVQGRLEWPIAAGFSLPLSVSYASRTETSAKREFSFGIGADFDIERILALARLGAL